MRMLLGVMSLLIYAMLSSADAQSMPPVPGSDSLGWSWVGTYADDGWLELNYRRLGRSSAPFTAGDEITATNTVHIRVGPKRFIDGGWRNQPSIGVAEPGDQFEILKVYEPYPGFVWVELAPLRDILHERDQLSADGSQVIDCFTSLSDEGPVTIQELRDCSGYWITPTVLLQCSLGARCSGLDDDTTGRAILEATLRRQNLTRNSIITLGPEHLTFMPDRQTLERCREAATSRVSFARCVAEATGGAERKAVTSCFSGRGGAEALECLANAADVDPDVARRLVALMDCAEDFAVTEETLLRCTGNTSAASAYNDVAQCLALGESASDRAACISTATMTSPNLAQCFQGSRSSREATICLLRETSGEENARLLRCLESEDVVNASLCFAGENSDVQRARDAYACAESAGDTASMVEDCSFGVLDKKSSKTLACTLRAEGERRRLVACAANSILSDETAHLVACASTSEGGTSLALCAAAPEMNEEWRIAAECAVQSGGEPMTFATCTAGRLTVREIIKCFDGEIGKDCFGPNNTIVVTLNKTFDGVKAAGDGLFKALEDVATEAPQQVGREAGKFLENLGRGLDNLGRALFRL